MIRLWFRPFAASPVRCHTDFITASSRALRTDEVWHNNVLASADSHGRARAEKDKESGEGKTIAAVVNTEQRKLAVIILCDGTNRVGRNT